MAECKKEYQPGFQIRTWGILHRENLKERCREKRKAAKTTLGFPAHTFAVAAVGCQLEAGFANALETAVFIDAHPVQTHVSDAALVHV